MQGQRIIPDADAQAINFDSDATQDDGLVIFCGVP